MEAIKKKYKGYYVACVCMLCFVFNDLIFDYLFSFNGSDAISFVFTLLASIIVFVWNQRLNKTKITGEFENISKFIKSNFDNWQVVFSILDIICGIISLMSGISFLACIFKFTKVFYIPAKIIVVTNKEKSLIKAISKGSLAWVIGRTLTNNKNKEDGKMKKIITNIKNNPRTILFGLLCAFVFGFAAFVGMENFNLSLQLWIKILLIAAICIIAFLLCCWLGWDNIKQATLFAASKTLSADKYDKVVEIAENLMKEQETEMKNKADLKLAEAINKKDEKEALALSKKKEKEDAKLTKKKEKEDAKLAKEKEKEDAKLAKEKAEKEREEYLLKLAANLKAQELIDAKEEKLEEKKLEEEKLEEEKKIEVFETAQEDRPVSE